MRSAIFSHLTMVLDDLQWADRSSLHLITQIMSDPDLSNLLIIGTSRPEGVELPAKDKDTNAHPPLVNMLEELKEKKFRREFTSYPDEH